MTAAACLVAMAFSTIPTPLYALYQQHDHFSSFVVTVVFAVYAVGVITSLLLAGHVSDWVGRCRVLVTALGIEVMVALLFLAWPQLPDLIVARFVSGLGIGMITATAHLRDLHARSHPHAGTGQFEVVSTAANLGGLDVGTLVSGAVAQVVGQPPRDAVRRARRPSRPRHGGPARRREAASSLFVPAYLGLIIPVLGIGTAMLFFTGTLVAILAAVAVAALRRPGAHAGLRRAPAPAHN